MKHGPKLLVANEGQLCIVSYMYVCVYYSIVYHISVRPVLWRLAGLLANGPRELKHVRFGRFGSVSYSFLELKQEARGLG